MRIEKFIESPIESYIYAERFINNGSPSGFSVNTTSESTCPNGRNDTFEVFVVEFDDNIRVDNVGDVSDTILPPNCVYCHPDNIELPIFKNIKEHWKIIDSVKVAPTASGRTVKLLEKQGGFIKLDYYGIIGRIRRNLDYKKLLSAYEVSSEIENALLSCRMNPDFSFFAEKFGRVAYLPTDENDGFYQFGFVLRDELPLGVKSNFAFYLPFFSLFGKDQNKPSDVCLGVQLFRKQSLNVTDFVFYKIIKPMIDSYFDVLIQCGMCLEAHSQNLLLAVNKNFEVSSVIARDMESVDKDIPLREYFGYDTSFKSEPYKCLHRADYNYQIMHSFMFDFKFGCYTIDPLLLMFKEVEDFDEEAVVMKIKDLVHDYMKFLPDDYFPSEWYNYENRIFNPKEKRPYVSHINPRYR